VVTSVIDAHVVRARRTAAWTRVVLGIVGMALILAEPHLLPKPAVGFAGFGTIMVTAIVQLFTPRRSWLEVEEMLACVVALSIVGLQSQRVTIISVLWLAAMACGVMGRGGRVHWLGRSIVLGTMVLPVAREGHLTLAYTGLFVAAVGLLLTSGRLMLELNHLLRQARWDADHDDLTGLLSRSAFRAALDTAAGAAERSNPLSLLLLDLDGFGRINKTVGHAAGDALLSSVGQQLLLLAGTKRPAGRLGGDEFAIAVSGPGSMLLAQRMLQTLPADAESSVRVSACVGIAQAPRDGSDAESLLRAADIALRVAKRGPRAGEISTYMGGSLIGRGRQSARGSLARLIAGEGLAMAVQPIVDLHTGCVHAYEALARFGEGGRDSPLHWFALAEELGEHDELERACLRQALALLPTRPRGRRLAVNLSAPVLLDRRTVQMLDRHRDLSGLIIEITEEALAQNHAQLRSTLAKLTDWGAQLAVDDMGAGYSGLGQITAVHPSYLKLDRSLVRGLAEDHDRAALIAALVSYAERVGSLLIAEGIEDEQELTAVLELGVPLAQGFHLGRPGRPWPLASIELPRPRPGQREIDLERPSLTLPTLVAEH
jgi:diguanylate cyclase (GGDEF)-like protein